MQLALGFSARDRRVLIVGVSVISALFGLTRGLPALVGWERQQVADAEMVSRQVMAGRVGVRKLPALRDTLRVRQAQLASLDSVLLSGASASAAAADLASTLEDMADTASVKVTAMQLRADSAAPGSLAQVAVRLSGVADVVGLARLLGAIEGGETPLLVRELSVTQPDPAAPNGKIEALRVDLLVEGLARISAPTPEKRR